MRSAKTKRLIIWFFTEKICKTLRGMLLITKPLSAKGYSTNQEVLMEHTNCSPNHFLFLGGPTETEEDYRSSKGNHNLD